MALFDTGAKDLALAAYDSGEPAIRPSRPTQGAQTDGVGPDPGPAVRHLGHGARAAAPHRTAPTSSPSPTTRASPSPASGSWASPRRRRSAASSTTRVSTGIKRFAVFAPQHHLRRPDGAHPGKPRRRCAAARIVATELYDEGSRLSTSAAKRLGRRDRQGRRQARRPGAGRAAPADHGAGLAHRRRRRQPKSVQLIGTGVWDVPGIGSETHAARRLVRRTRSGAARRLRAQVHGRPTAGRRSAWRRSPMTRWRSPASSRALKPGGDFSAEAHHQSQRLVGRRRRVPLPARRPHPSALWR